MRKRTIRHFFWVLSLCLFAVGSVRAAEPSVQATMDEIVGRLYATFDQEKLLKLDEQTVESFITPDERRVLATKYWCFDANVPVIVSVMRDVAQPVAPFWLAEAGFKKTDLRVKNEEYTYEVWQKAFGAGRVELGINGFDKHRPHYFVCVGPEQAGAKVELSHLLPADTTIADMRVGAFTYQDWDDLYLTEVPDGLKGQILLQTIRGRAREAHLIEAFRKTPFPASEKPDQIVLTWAEDPRTTQAIQWRTSPSVTEGVVRYKEKQAGDAGEWNEARAECQKIDDRLLANDRYIHHFTALLRGLKPATAYMYTVGSKAAEQRSESAEFTTAPDGAAPFSFVFLSDTHNKPVTGTLLASALEKQPNVAFCTISGDLVGTGQYRDDWDQFFEYSRDFFKGHALAPSMGNHDTIDGLGADLYRGLFALPTNGAPKLEPERSYSFQYGNALFLMLDATSKISDETSWLEQQLAASKATWKFAVFHFPPYAADEDYPDIRREWCTLFDKYHVDFVLSGHVHYYLRTYPLKDGKRVASPADGTVYVVSVSVPGDRVRNAKPDFAEVAGIPGAPFYEVFTIDGKCLSARAYDLEGKVRDEFAVEK